MTLTHFKFIFHSSIQDIGQILWNKLAQGHSPFCQYNFLHALESSHSVGAESGWFPQHLVIYQNSEPVGILPLYKKSHSYGEYVFDFAWANTYRQYGVNYYPKLVSAIPFTPVSGPRLMLSKGLDETLLLTELRQKIDQHMQQMGLSSMHWLFVEQDFSDTLKTQGQVQRLSVQFEWFNRGYSSFADYLDCFNSRKRKNLKKERAKVVNAGIEVVRLRGTDISAADMAFFYQCYKQTYLKRSGHEGYLTQAFFTSLLSSMGENLLLVKALKDQQPVASALFIFDQNQLCGRYWGALEELENLHFECCYYQGIEFCIEQNIARFNPGTQGEHKILRGFEPIYCYSNHALKELAFHEAVERFIIQEKEHIDKYKMDAERLLPFKQTQCNN